MSDEWGISSGSAGAASVAGTALSHSSLITHHSPLPPSLAHGGEPHHWPDLLTTWGWEPFTWLGLIVSLCLYVVGLRRLWRAAGRGGAGVRRWEAWCFAGGWFALFVALVSPLHPWGKVLFAAHMTQHEILMLVAAPLLVLGRPLVVSLRALPARWAHALGRASNRPGWQRAWRFVSGAFVAWLLHFVLLWAWHIPSWFQATLDNEFVHALQHLSFLLSALLFWWAVMQGRNAAVNYGLAVLYMLTTAIHSGLLGALITFAGTVWYPAYAGKTDSWGLTALEDQQLGGLIMWVPACTVYVVAGLAFFAGWLRESEKLVLRREGRAADAVVGEVGG
jgi:putative membrane protein